ncbi:MAG TPA: class C sortase [Clostridiales bacterium]|nr:class C sortase [Clostridiales bacterium]
MIKRKIGIGLGIIVFLVGLTILLFPHINNAISKHIEANIVADFQKTFHVGERSQGASGQISQYGDLYDALQVYNKSIFDNHQSEMTTTAFADFPVPLGDYGLADDGIGYITIPKMNLELPLNLGASKENMANGVGVCGYTSAPVGGVNTNCVIAGHRGYRGTAKFRYIEKLKAGDLVYITNIWETLTYQVKETKIVDPDDISDIRIVEGKDLVTLLTCHPYASDGKYRYIVICERVDR